MFLIAGCTDEDKEETGAGDGAVAGDTENSEANGADGAVAGDTENPESVDGSAENESVEDETASSVINFPRVETYICVKNGDTSTYEIRRSGNLNCRTSVDGTCCGLVLVEGSNRTLVSKEVLEFGQCNVLVYANSGLGSPHLSDANKNRAGGTCIEQ